MGVLDRNVSVIVRILVLPDLPDPLEHSETMDFRVFLARMVTMDKTQRNSNRQEPKDASNALREHPDHQEPLESKE